MPPALTRSLARSPHTEIIDGKETAATIRQELKALGGAATYKDVVEKRLVVVEPTATRAPPAAVGI